MSSAMFSIAALAAVLALSARKGLNTGAAALALAAVVGRWAFPMSGESVALLFPSSLFLMLLGVTLLFGMAKANGTLDILTCLLLRGAGCGARLLPPVFFAMALALSAVGAGNIAAVALLAPVAFDVARRSGVGLVLTSFMLVTGANAGAFSPLAFTGVIASALSQRSGLELSPWSQIFAPSFAAQAGLAALGYALAWPGLSRAAGLEGPRACLRPDGSQKLTLAALAALLAATLWLRLDVGWIALLLSAVLALARAADQEEALARLPWAAIVMVCGVSTLVGVAARCGGMELLADWLSRAGSAPAVAATVSFTAAFTSIYSSSSGVVMPAFLAMVPDLAARSGAAPAALACAVNVSSHLVDISPLSTLGALCVAAVPAAERDFVFRRLLYGGLGMSLVAALLGYFVFGRLSHV